MVVTWHILTPVSFFGPWIPLRCSGGSSLSSVLVWTGGNQFHSPMNSQFIHHPMDLDENIAQTQIQWFYCHVSVDVFLLKWPQWVYPVCPGTNIRWLPDTVMSPSYGKLPILGGLTLYKGWCPMLNYDREIFDSTHSTPSNIHFCWLTTVSNTT